MSGTSRLSWRFAIMLLLAGLAGVLAGTRPQLEVRQVTAGGSAQVSHPGDPAWPENGSMSTPVAAGERRVLLRLPALLPAQLRYHPSDQPGPVEIGAIAVRFPGLPLRTALAFEPLTAAQQGVSRDFEPETVPAAAQAAASVLVQVPWWVRAWMLLPAAILAAACFLAFAARHKLRGESTDSAEASYKAWFPLLFLAACYGVMVYQAIWLGPWQPMWDDWRYLFPGPFSLVEGQYKWLGIAGNDTYFLTGQVLDWAALQLSGGNFLAIRLLALALLGVFLVFAARLALSLPRQQALLALLAFAFVLGADGYWTLQAIAYHQFLPVLFLMIAIAILQRQWQDPESPGLGSTLALAACALLAGLAYISGALLFLTFVVALGVGLRTTAARAGFRRNLPLLTLFVVALAVTVLQLWMVTQVQGSLLERTHATQTVLPTDWRFWAFQVGLLSRTLGLHTAPPIFELVAYAMIMAAGLYLLVWSWRARGAERFQPVTGVGLLASAFVYASVVAAGRAGFAAPDAPWEQVVGMAASRFHFWWLAALLPVPLAMVIGQLRGFRRWGRVVVPVAAGLLVLVKIDSVRDDHAAYQRAGQQEALGIACVRATYDQPGPLLCVGFYPVDFRAAVDAARQHDLRLWHSLMQVP